MDSRDSPGDPEHGEAHGGHLDRHVAEGRSPESTRPIAVTARRPWGQQNARSFLHSSYCGQENESDLAHSPYYSSYGVREQTAELATRALSEASSIHNGSPPAYAAPPGSRIRIENSPSRTGGCSRRTVERHGSIQASRLEGYRIAKPLQTPPSKESSQKSNGDSVSETDPLIPSPAEENLPQANGAYGSADRGRRLPIERLQDIGGAGSWSGTARRAFSQILSGKNWHWRSVWKRAVLEPVSCIPAVALGLLLNVLDGLSYGLILFPLGEEIFSDLGADGLSMFYVSCIVSQIVFSCGGSRFRGGVGSEMIEVVPFFHNMASTILREIGPDYRDRVLATTILSYAISSIITGAVFFLLGSLKLGALIGFFPRHILVGCIGGVGLFLMATGLEVSARLDGNLDYASIVVLFQSNTIALWGVPFVLAVALIVLQRHVKHSLLVPLYFMAIPVVFHFIVILIPSLSLNDLRRAGWIFDAPDSGVPFWHFYELYDFSNVDWLVLLRTVPAMFALTFFGILHVPINVPALAVSTGEDNIDVDRELIAHGVSNALSGAVGSIQNYLVYTNSILFIRGGGDSRLAGLMLAAATFGVMAAGPSIIGFIPVMEVGALIFLLGIELLKEALYDTWGRLSKLEYLTIFIIVVVMGLWDFVIGILVGIVLACISLVVSASRKSPIRATYSGVIARSTVRRPPIQQRFLRQVGRQTQIVKLAGYIFFGSIPSVETWVRDLLEEQQFYTEPIRHVIIDFHHVTGIDFSAAEAFTRMQRLLSVRSVQMVLCGVYSAGEVGQALRSVGLWSDTDPKIQIFEDLNFALESCENEFLSAFYRHGEEHTRNTSHSGHLDVPQSRPSDAAGFDGSPRRTLVQEAATTILQQEEVSRPSTWQKFRRPLPLILQTFQGMTEKNEDFWFHATKYFKERRFAKGSVLFQPGDKASEFYLIEEGILRAEYDLDQGRFSESIVAGTTCGELPFFSQTERTALMVAEKDTVAWVINENDWNTLRDVHPQIAIELLQISMKLTSERMAAITSYVLTIAG